MKRKGPVEASCDLRRFQVVSLRKESLSEVRRFTAELRASLASKQSTTWARLSEPRGIIASLIEKRGWRVANAEKIPHDLWAAGVLPEMTLAEQLTVLLIGFDLTFKAEPSERS